MEGGAVGHNFEMGLSQGLSLPGLVLFGSAVSEEKI